MRRRSILIVSVLMFVAFSGYVYAGQKKASSEQGAQSVKEFTGESRGADGVARTYWIRKDEGSKELVFTCDGKSLLITGKEKKAFSAIDMKAFVDLFKINEIVTVTYVEKGGKNIVKTIGSKAAIK